MKEEVKIFPSKNAIRNKTFDESIYYNLKENEIINLDKEQVHTKIINELNSFTTTDAFKQSFFAKAQSIVVDFNGAVIWDRTNK